MPYRYAHYVLLGLVPLIGLAFWPRYFSRLGDVSLAIHVHGATATVWILMLTVQSWAIHNRRVSLHRLTGRVSFVVFPLFMVGGFMMLHNMAHGVAVQANPFVSRYGPGLGLIDALAVGTFAAFYYLALRNRRQVQLHARYMLATPLFLVMPIVTRLLINYVPALAIRGPEDLHRFIPGIHTAGVVALAVALVLYASNPRYGRPFLVAAVVTVVCMAGFQWVGPTSWWGNLYAGLASLPFASTILGGLLVGGTIVYLGWHGAARRPGRRPLPEAAA
jgi:hypothetical protein